MAEAKKPKAEPAKKEALPAIAPGLVTPWPPRQLSVQARQAGFRRAGRAWPAEAVIVDAAEFTEEQLGQLAADPMLIIEAVE